ncbi:MAG: adenosylmethionine decarboxylase [Candidatus Latescibacterota bacterium]
MQKGRHLLIDCCQVPREVCLDDAAFLDAMARAARRAGATVISQVRYQFGHNSPPGFAAVVVLDESHCSAHSYADLGLIAVDIFTCGQTDPYELLRFLRQDLPLGSISVQEVGRFVVCEGEPLSRTAPSGGRERGT